MGIDSPVLVGRLPNSLGRGYCHRRTARPLAPCRHRKQVFDRRRLDRGCNYMKHPWSCSRLSTLACPGMSLRRTSHLGQFERCRRRSRATSNRTQACSANLFRSGNWRHSLGLGLVDRKFLPAQCGCYRIGTGPRTAHRQRICNQGLESCNPRNNQDCPGRFPNHILHPGLQRRHRTCNSRYRLRPWAGRRGLVRLGRCRCSRHQPAYCRHRTVR